MNPIHSVVSWFAATRHGAAQHKLYEALCMEECGEQLQAFVVVDIATGEADKSQAHFAQALKDYSTTLRQFPELGIRVENKAELLDAHLDSAWVHLCAALAMLGDANDLAMAWNELHRANVEDKRWPDGTFRLDDGGKVLKPPGWTKPDYSQFFPPAEAATALADTEGGAPD